MTVTQYIMRVIAGAVVFAVLLFCHGDTMGMGNMSVDHGGSGSMSQESMPCCDFESPGSLIMHSWAVFGGLFHELILLVINVGFVLFFRHIFQENYAAKSYILSLRRKYGSPQVLYYIRRLFSVGILHPKTW